MRKLRIGLVLAVSACSTPPTPNLNPSGEAAASAYFKGYPDHFFETAAAICNDPAQTLIRPNQNQLRCESLPDPETAAALILQYDGTVEDLPTFVVAFSGQQDTTGYLVTADIYINIPLRAGDATQLRFPDPQTENEFETLLEQAGGRPQ